MAVVRKPSEFSMDGGWQSRICLGAAFFFAIYVALTLFRILLPFQNALDFQRGFCSFPPQVSPVEALSAVRGFNF